MSKTTKDHKGVEKAVDGMTALCEQGRAQVKDLLRALGHLPQEEKVGRYAARGVYFKISDIRSTVDEFNWDDDVTDARLFEAGNMFRTKELAEKYAKKRAARNRLELLALELNGEDWEPSMGTTKYFLRAHSSGLKVGVSMGAWYSVHSYFKTEALALQALDVTTDEDLEILFGTSERG